MSLVRYFIVAGALLFWALPGNADAGRKPSKNYKWDLITEKDWAVQEDTALGMRDAVILFERIESDETKWDIDKVFYSVYRRIRVLSDEGRGWGDVTIPWYSKKQKIKLIAARVVLRDGTILPLDPKSIVEKEIVKTKGLKIKQKSFSLGGVTNDCIVEYAYQLRMPNSVRIWRIQRDAYLVQGQLRWKFFQATSAKYGSYANKLAPNYLWVHAKKNVSVKRLPSLKDTKELIFSIDNVQSLKNEPYALPDVARQAQLRYYYGASGSADAYWAETADGLSEALDEFCSRDKKIKDVAKSMSLFNSEEKRISAAYLWVQKTFRNTSYADDDEKFKKVKNVDAVFKRGYASRRQLNYLFCDLLREMDIDARVAFVVDRDDNLLVFDAKYWQFDRSLVAVPDGESYRFYSPGDLFRPPGLVAWYNQGISALVGGDTRRTFYSVAWNKPTTNSVNRLVTLQLNDDLTLSGSSAERLKGDPAYSLRFYLSDLFAERLQEELDEHYESVFPDAKIDSIEMENGKNLSKSLVMKHNIKYETPLQRVGSRLMMKPLRYLSSTTNSFDEKNRETNIVLSYAFQTNETASITIPPTWNIEALPSDTAFSNAVGTCAVTFTKIGSTLSAQRQFTLNSPFWGPEKYADVQALYESREAISNLTVVLRQSDKSSKNPTNASTDSE